MVKKERILSIDMIRGLSILGIFLVNMMDFHSPLLYIDPLKWWEAPLERITYILIDVFAQASFYPLFSLMFGFSMVLLLEKANNRGLNFTKLGLRRLFVLLVFGVIHAFFVWHGDILIQYAAMGLILLLFLPLSGRSLVTMGIIVYLVPVIFFNLMLVGFSGQEMEMFDREAAQQSIQTYSKGSFIDITHQRITDWRATNNPENFPFLFISIFPLFLIGAGIAKLRWLENADRYREQFSLVLLITLAFGVFLKSLPYLYNGAPFAQYTQDSIGGVCLAVFYAVFIIKLAEKVKGLSLLAAVGRMSISNYLFQSLLSSFIFYQYGLGLYGRVSLFSGTVLVFVIFWFQILVSQWWLRRFAFGPVEWLWRALSYLQPVKLRKHEG